MDDLLFTLRVRLSNGIAIIRAYDTGETYHETGHSRIDLSLGFSTAYRGPRRAPTRTIFPKGFLYVGIPSGKTIDGRYAKEAAISTFALRPGDTDREFFADYSDEQIDFVSQYSDELKAEGERRYGRP